MRLSLSSFFTTVLLFVVLACSVHSTVLAQTVQVVSPNGGQTFSAGQRVQISWTSSGVTQVNLAYSSDGGSTWNTIAGPINATPASFTWNTPGDLWGSQIRVRVVDATNAGIFDASDNNFKLGNDTLLNTGFVWSYYDLATAPPSDWNTVGFNAGSWATGPSKLGYGNSGSGADATVISFGSSSSNKIRSYYFIRRVFIPNINDIASTSMAIVRDDGAIAYVNGVEVWRNNMPSGTVSHTTFANVTVGSNTTTWNEFNVAKSNFVSGWNTIAVRVHQVAATSSDISFDCRLIATIPVTTLTVPSPVAGQNVNAGQALPISWTSNFFQNVNVEFSSNNGSTWNTLASNIPAMPNTYWWNVPSDLNSNQVLARVSSAVDNTNNATSGLFNVAVTDTLVKFGAFWSYLDNGQPFPSNWNQTGFDYSTWANGRTPIGYGDPFISTIIGFGPDGNNKYPATLLHRRVYIPDASIHSVYNLGLVRDDGAIIYVNGNEVLRDNMPQTGVDHLTYAPNTIDGLEETAVNPFALPAGTFQTGWNNITVQLHNRSASSSDLNINLQLVAFQGYVAPFSVTSPAAYAFFYPGQNANISWTNNLGLTGNVQIEVSTDNGTTWSTIAASLPITPATYVWPVTNTPGTSCLVRIKSLTDPTKFAESALPFVIKEVPAFDKCADPGHIGCFTSVSPQAQSQTMRISSAHEFQRLARTGNALTLGNTFGGSPDFTAFVPRVIGTDSNGKPIYSNTWGDLSVNSETSPGAVNILHIKFNPINQLWVIDSSGRVEFSTANGLVLTATNCSGGITPWGTVVSAEETFSTGDANGDGYTDVGWLVEIDPITRQVRDYDNDGKRDKLWAMGRMAHENVVFMQDSLTAYYGEDGGTQCLYKFVANQKTRFDEGTLYVMQRTGTTGTWIQVPNTTQSDRNNTRTIAGNLGGTNFNGLEDVEYNPLNGMHYFTSKGNSLIYRFRDMGTFVTEFENYVGASTTQYAITHSTGTTNEVWGTGIDNLAFDDKGSLWAFQDGSRNHAWVVRPDHTPLSPKVDLFATTPAGSEPCGLTFTPDFKYGFMSIQHPNTSNSASQLDAAKQSVVFNTGTTLVFARAQNIGCEPKGSSLTTTVCDSLIWQGQTYKTSGTFTKTVVDAGGCDSVLTLNLTVLYGFSQNQTASACGTYTWAINNMTYTQSGTYVATYAAANGCDSVYTLMLEVETPLVYYVDNDGDGYGAGTGTVSCTAPGITALAGDCNDSNTSINPAVSELCNGVDDNCDGVSELNTLCQIPTINKVVSVNGNNASFNWTLGCYKGFRMQYRRTTPLNQQWLFVILPLAPQAYTLNGLTPGTYQWGLRGTCYNPASVLSGVAYGNNFTIANNNLVAQANGTLTAADAVSVVPNPADQTVSVSFNLSQQATVAVFRMVDMTGRVVYNQALSAEAPVNHDINISTIATGVYTIQIIANGGLDPITTSLVIQH